LTDIELGTNATQEYKDYCSSISGNSSSNNCNSDSLSISAGYGRDTRNNAQFPTSEQMFRESAQVGVPVFDMNYYVLSGKAEKYWPLQGGMSFKLKGTVGFADSYGDKKFPFFKNFFMGGTNTVRGYDQASVGEKTLNASTGALETTGGKKSLLGSAELFFPPPGLKNVKSFRLSTFIDGGGVFKNGVDADLARFSAGVGAVWLSPFGPLSITYAKALNDDINDKLKTLQFGMGGAF